MGKFIKECFLQKTNQFDALSVWEDLGMGKNVDLTYDEKKEKIIARLESDKSKVIGVLSEEDSKSLKPFFEAGWNTFETENGNLPEIVSKLLFYGTISKFDEKADENKRISICIFVKDASEYAGG